MNTATIREVFIQVHRIIHKKEDESMLKINFNSSFSFNNGSSELEIKDTIRQASNPGLNEPVPLPFSNNEKFKRTSYWNTSRLISRNPKVSNKKIDSPLYSTENNYCNKFSCYVS